MLAAFIVALVAIPYLPGGIVTSQTQNSVTHIFGFVGDWEPLATHPQVRNRKGAFFQWGCPRHDPTLGPLRSVEVHVYKRSKYTWQLENLWPTGFTQICWLYKKDEVTFLEAQLHHWPLYVSPWSGFAALGHSALLDPFDGILDFGGVSGHTSTDWFPAFWEKAQKNYTQALLLQDFTGRGPMAMELTVSTGFWTTSPIGQEVGRLDGTSYVRVLVRYHY